MRVCEEDPFSQLCLFIEYSDPSFKETIGEDDVKIIKGKLLYHQHTFPFSIRFDSDVLRNQIVRSSYFSHQDIERIPPSIYREKFEILLSSFMSNAILIPGAGTEAPYIAVGKYIEELATHPTRIQRIEINEFIEKIIFFQPCPVVEKVVELSNEFEAPIFTENWTRNFSKCKPKLSINYFFDNKVSYDKSTRTLTIEIGHINTTIRNKYMNEILETRNLILLGTSLRSMDIIAGGLDHAREKGMRIPVLYVTKMPEIKMERPKNETDKEEWERFTLTLLESMLPRAILDLGAIIVVYEDLRKLLPHIDAKKLKELSKLKKWIYKKQKRY